jgi:hypothetical protein
MKKINDKLAAALASAKRDIPSLERIMQLAVLEDASDASGALGDGCVLLAIASIDNDNDGDGFRYLLGLPRGTDVTGYLSNFFEED